MKTNQRLIEYYTHKEPNERGWVEVHPKELADLILLAKKVMEKNS